VSRRVLVAGIGNIFLGDDGFGVEVVRRLAAEPLPRGVEVADFGIRGIHLAYELLEKAYDTTILVDAMPRGGEPGTVYVLEPETMPPAPAVAADAHAMTPEAVLRWLRSLGGAPGRLFVVGCDPARTEEEMGLSEPVAAAVGRAVEVVRELVQKEQAGA
jgi:hydrogenase maturation protease